jgi:hypothetical protein
MNRFINSLNNPATVGFQLAQLVVLIAISFGIMGISAKLSASK